ncbi:MAG: Flagellar FliJ protein [Thermoleophilia bacterium]|nr:Flagellar FliJ protein [Thermoleophilia bacterium]
MREKQAQQELQARRQQVMAEEHRLVEMQHEEVQLREEQKLPLARGGDLYQFQMRRHFLEKAIVENVQGQEQQHGRIQQAKDAVVQQQDVVKQRGIDVKALEKLKEKQREEHRLEQLREEGLFMDDLAGQGFLRRKNIAAMVAAEEAAAREVALEAAPPPPTTAPLPPVQTAGSEGTRS